MLLISRRTAALVTAASICLLCQSGVSKEVHVVVAQMTASSGHKVSFDVMELLGKRVPALWVSDKHNIKTNLVALDRAQLLHMKDMIDATLIELDGPPPTGEAGK